MKIAAIQMNPTVGAIEANAQAILGYYAVAASAGVDVVILPEAALSGYPLEDLVLRESFMAGVIEQVRRIEDEVRKMGHTAALIFGTPWPTEGGVTNSACVIDPSRPDLQWVNKYELPNYGVFDEKRHFVPADLSKIAPVEIAGRRIGLMICEDCWFPTVAKKLRLQRAEILISINGSPFEAGKNVTRRQVVAKRIKETGLPFVYLNMVGGQDELVFDGGSFAYDGYRLQEAPHFVEGVNFFEMQIEPASLAKVSRIDLTNFPKVEPTDVEAVYRAIVLGTRDYLRKQGFKSVVLGYSGGVDSGLVAAVAADAIGADNVHLVRLPSKFSSDHSLSDAEEGAERLGCPMTTIEIEGIVDELRNSYTMARRHYIHPQKVFALQGTADENIQARSRGNILMAISNQEGRLLLTTGNKSEVSVGYATLYGDMSGGFNPIKDCYKTMVWALCRWRNGLDEASLGSYGFLGRVGDVVPEAIITKPPSAELRPDQKDTDSLPPYPVLDAILDGMIERELSSAEIVAEGIADEETVRRIRRLVDMAEYKRRQAAPGVKITTKIYGRDRRYPIVNHWRG